MISWLHRQIGRLFQRVGQAQQRLLHVIAYALGLDGRQDLRGQSERCHHDLPPTA